MQSLIADKKPSAETWRLSEDSMGPWRHFDAGRELRLIAGQTLYHQGEVSTYFYLIISGKVEVSMVREDGSYFMVEIMGAGALCGEGAAFDGMPRFSSAVATCNTVVKRFDASRLHEAFQEAPELALSLIRVLAAKQRIMSRRAQHLSAPSPEVRIGDLLLRLAETYGRADQPTRLVPITLTHEQISTMTGTSRVTVTRWLTKMRKLGALMVVDGTVYIKDANLIPR
ncbi:Crp/Fnr family transcriptional regulator [Bradyrhizobium sp. CCH5-F6]|jgi:CRP/FNR family transcriptional regulator, cyclic AMP receptor protein|uniref:Crp/Fnr family transcriptional regulator n=1 Tax=Bradyrhizobium sp. CCH5-F6 TaxID=1768753 RepID=UPI00076A01C3|nr:Crp/Fnr family transcriptional regulator [Bradyrhizobium sp. CCH5-F6]